MENKRKWLLTGLLIALSFVLITGCSGNEETEKAGNQDTAGEAENQEDQANEETPAGDETTQEGEGQAPNTSLEADADLETQLEEDEGIDDVMVQVVEGDRKAVNVDIQINDQQALSADELIEKYSPVIKEKYPDHIVDIIVAKDGSIVKQTTLE